MHKFYKGEKVIHDFYGEGIIDCVSENGAGEPCYEIFFKNYGKCITVMDSGNLHRSEDDIKEQQDAALRLLKSIFGACLEDEEDKEDEKKTREPETRERKITLDGNGNAIGGGVFGGNFNSFRKEEKKESINHPSHYNDGQIEVIDFIEDIGLGTGFNLGNAIKYLARAGKKDVGKTVEDLKKARWYIKRQADIWDKKSSFKPNNIESEKYTGIQFALDQKLDYASGLAINSIYHALHEKNIELRSGHMNDALGALDHYIKALEGGKK